MRTIKASYFAVSSVNSTTSVLFFSESKRMRSHAPPAAITPFAIGIESMRLPSGPLSEPPFFAPGTLNCTTQSLNSAPAGDSRSVLYRPVVIFISAAAGPATRWLKKPTTESIKLPAGAAASPFLSFIEAAFWMIDAASSSFALRSDSLVRFTMRKSAAACWISAAASSISCAIPCSCFVGGPPAVVPAGEEDAQPMSR